MPTQPETDYDVDIRISFPTYGTPEQRRKTAENVKRILEVKLQRPVEVMLKVGNELQPVERTDSNGAVSP